MILHKMFIRNIIPVFLVTLLFFVMILQLLDLFANLWRYLQNDVPISQILYLALLYMPKCIILSLPVAVLFSISFTLGNHYASNELISVFGSGISLFQFTYPVFILAFLISLFGLFFEDAVVIKTFKRKNELANELMHTGAGYSRSNVVKLSKGGRVVYYANYYNDKTKTLSGLIYLERREEGGIERRIDAQYARFEEDRWILNKARIFQWTAEGDFLEEDYREKLQDPVINEEPNVFRKQESNVDEMRLKEAKEYIAFLARNKLPLLEAKTDYYNRYAFSLTPLIVAIISSALGGRFKKNILLMSLLLSLVIGVAYYVIQMVTVILAKLGYMPPVIGAWFGVILVLILGSYLFYNAKT